MLAFHTVSVAPESESQFHLILASSSQAALKAQSASLQNYLLKILHLEINKSRVARYC
jgi:hypothetical protein